MQQAMGGLQIYRNGVVARGFVREVLDAATDPRVLTDKLNTQGLENLPEFKDHRHDQAVLTIVAWHHRLPRFPDPTQYGHEGRRPALISGPDGLERPAANFARILNLHRKSDYTALRRAWGFFNPIKPGRWQDCEAEIDLQ